jgi:aminoglycoside phosphotransferase (APT) family kinase protein
MRLRCDRVDQFRLLRTSAARAASLPVPSGLVHQLDEMPDRLTQFLRRHHPDRASVTVEHYEVLPGGYSRAMAKATVRWDADTVETLILRGDPPAGVALFDTDRSAEWSLLSALTEIAEISMPAARYFDATGDELGTKCIVLELAHGPSLQALLTAHPEQGDASALDRLADLAAQVVLTPIERLPTSVPRPESWDAFMDQRIGAWKATEQSVDFSDPFMRYVGAWLDANRPAPIELRLIHGDFQNSNILVDPADGRFQLIDWEFTQLGDPRNDLGWYQAYSSAAPPNLIENDPMRFCQRYCDATGFSLEQVNPISIGYFTILGAIQIFAQLTSTTNEFAKGNGSGIGVPYNVNAMSFGHKIWLEVSQALEAAMAQMGAAQ